MNLFLFTRFQFNFIHMAPNHNNRVGFSSGGSAAHLLNLHLRKLVFQFLAAPTPMDAPCFIHCSVSIQQKSTAKV